MKKTKLLFPLVAALLLTGCGGTSNSQVNDSNEDVSEEVSPTLTSLSINSEVTEVYVNQTIQLTFSSNIPTSNVKWSVDNKEIATISLSGLLRGKQAGKVVVKVESKDDDQIFDTKEFTIKSTVVDTNYESEAFDYDGVFSDDPKFISRPELSNTLNSYTPFTDVTGKAYLASATVNLSNPKTDDTWSRISIGHMNINNKFHGMILSPGPNFSQPKTVVMDVINGEVQWGVVTDRSQVWGQHDLRNIDWNNVKLTSIRLNEEYYYYVNDKLVWQERYWDDYDEIDTTPTFMAAQCQVSVSKLYRSNNLDEITSYVNDETKNLEFLPSNQNNVIVNKENGQLSVEFKNNNNYDAIAPLNVKDNCARSTGDLAGLPANKEATIEYDLTIKQYGGRDAMPAVGVSLIHHEGNVKETRTCLVSERRIGFTGWNYDADMPNGIGSQGTDNLSSPLKENRVYHVVVKRLMLENSQDCSIKVIDTTTNETIGEVTWGWTSEANSKGNMTLTLMSRDLDCKLENITLTY